MTDLTKTPLDSLLKLYEHEIEWFRDPSDIRAEILRRFSEGPSDCGGPTRDELLALVRDIASSGRISSTKGSGYANNNGWHNVRMNGALLARLDAAAANQGTTNCTAPPLVRCDICGVGTLVPLRLAICTACESETASAEDLKANAEAMKAARADGPARGPEND